MLWKRWRGPGESLKRAAGKVTGVPTSQGGRDRKLGKFFRGGGCLLAFAAIPAGVLLAVWTMA